jgi:hypothetical protein
VCKFLSESIKNNKAKLKLGPKSVTALLCEADLPAWHKVQDQHFPTGHGWNMPGTGGIHHPGFRLAIKAFTAANATFLNTTPIFSPSLKMR